jgi:ribose-phosphate pyrophosphokinase
MANRKLQDAMPLAPLKIVAMGGCSEIGKRVNEIIIARRKEALAASNKPDFMTSDYSIDNYLVDFECLRFGRTCCRQRIDPRKRSVHYIGYCQLS